MKQIIPTVIICCLFLQSTSAQITSPLPAEFRRHDVERTVDIKIGGKIFATYYHPRETELKKPVLWPIYTASGKEITRGYPLKPRPGERTDHPHHVGLWFNFGDVNGLDFWNNSNSIGPEHKGPFGTIRHKEIVKVNSKTGTLDVTSTWGDAQAKPVLNETTQFVFSGDANTRIIDRITTLKALDKEVSFKDNKEGMLGLRVARWLEHPSTKPEIFTDAKGNPTAAPKMDTVGVHGKYLSSQGLVGDAVWGTRAKWMNLSSDVDGEKVSVLILDNSHNPGYPTWWHARGYGLFAANPFGASVFSNGKEKLDFKLDAGKSITFRFRIVIRNGNHITAEQANAWSEQFEKETGNK